MEDDDEFGDLYTDVLRPLSAASQSPQTFPAPSSLRPIDFNIKSNDQVLPPYPASVSDSNLPYSLPTTTHPPSSHAPPRADTDGEFTYINDAKVKFDVEEANNRISNEDDDPGIGIPGISQNVSQGDDQNEGHKQNNIAGGEEDEDWESDSEDDLQIVLNEENHRQMLVDEGGGNDIDEEDALVIVADADASNHQGLVVEQKEWGGDETSTQMGEGGIEKEGAGERASGATAAAAAAATAKIGYSNHFAYHNPYHSQFKYVRPGAALIPGSATAGAAGAPGQVRPLINMGPTAGHGRGDWRPPGMKPALPMQKGFHPSFGAANMPGRGLEFTLPSHKSIFEVDIDGFEEKPWKYPGIDISDFFNFGLNEERWKDYCKQLEQYRLETTMQSKIRVYESGREQEYDPDLPPELAAATGIRDVPADNANPGKLDVAQSDFNKGTGRVRQPLPTGRAIQVESSSIERLPSVDTRPPRIRDSDAIIEIVCQGTVDEHSCTVNGDRDIGHPRENHRVESHEVEDEMGPADTECADGFPDAYDNQKSELVRHVAPFMNVVRNNIPEGSGVLPFSPETSVQDRPGSRGPIPKYPDKNVRNAHEQRQRPGRIGDRSPHMSPSQSPQFKEFHDNQYEESVESIKGKQSSLSSLVRVRDEELIVEHKDDVRDEFLPDDGSATMAKEETKTVIMSDNLNDENKHHSLKKPKTNSQVEQPELQEFDDEEDSRAARSSDNSKARSSSSRDHKKWRDGIEEEVIQDKRSMRVGMKKHLEENEQSFRRKDREGKQEMERNRTVAKGREGSYSHRDFDPTLTYDMQMKSEGFDRRKERENSDGVWQRRDDEPDTGKNRFEDTRKRGREHLDEIGPRHKGKARESERIDRDEYSHSRKQLDNGSSRPHYDKDAGMRRRERDDSLKSRYEMAEDFMSKRRKDDEYIRWDHAEKDEILHSHRDATSRRKRERDDILDQRRREEQLRIRDNFDDHPVRHKDDGWLQRERGERQREREEWQRLKPHEEILQKREKEEGRGSVRSGRSSEDRSWVGHARMKDEYKGSDKEYQLKDTHRHSDQRKRRERVEVESLPPHREREDASARGNQFTNEDRKSRQERSGPRNDHSANTSDNLRVNEKKHIGSSRKNRESEVGDVNSLVASRSNPENQGGHVSKMGVKGTPEQGNGMNEKPVHRNSSRKEKEEASSKDGHQDSRRGRSKLERWTSHKERDFDLNKKSSASLKFNENNRNNSSGTLETRKPPEEPVDKKLLLADKQDGDNLEIMVVDTKPADDRHLDTVEKLKKRSARFKLPMPSEKDPLAIKKMESEPLPSSNSETPAELEVKQERPARKRRWISN